MSERALYHGSKVQGIEILQPRQALNGHRLVGVEPPAVYASPHVETANFMAIAGSRRWGGWDYTRYKGAGFFIFEPFYELLRSQPDDKVLGAVYELDRAFFEKSPYNEWRCVSPVMAIGSRAVFVSDLPEVTVVAEPCPCRITVDRSIETYFSDTPFSAASH